MREIKMTIYKYKLGRVEHQVIELPKNFKPLRTEFQDGQLCLWSIVDLESGKENFDFYIFGTGQINNDLIELTYISTVFIDGFVWHIFYREV